MLYFTRSIFVNILSTRWSLTINICIFIVHHMTMINFISNKQLFNSIIFCLLFHAASSTVSNISIFIPYLFLVDTYNFILYRKHLFGLNRSIWGWTQGDLLDYWIELITYLVLLQCHALPVHLWTSYRTLPSFNPLTNPVLGI